MAYRRGKDKDNNCLLKPPHRPRGARMTPRRQREFQQDESEVCSRTHIEIIGVLGSNNCRRPRRRRFRRSVEVDDRTRHDEAESNVSTL
jgi:hypothetical protein